MPATIARDKAGLSRAKLASLADAACLKPSAGLSAGRSSCDSKCQSAPCASATQGTTRIKPPPGVPWDAGGEAKAEALTLPSLHAPTLS
jgi:hypothetical protein